MSDEHAEIDGVEIHWRREGDAPILYVHGVPTAGWQWDPFLELTGGVAPDLPGFGKSGKPNSFDYSITGYDRFLERFTETVGLERMSLVVHDWGGVGLAFAQRFPERVERLVLLTCLPLLPGYEWHRIARLWQTPLLGELSMGFTNKRLWKRNLPEHIAERSWEDFDHGTQRAILKLYRSGTPDVLAAAGAHLDRLRVPTLVLWPDDDEYISVDFGQRYADALGGELEVVEGGHWTWVDNPGVIERTARFLGG